MVFVSAQDRVNLSTSRAPIFARAQSAGKKIFINVFRDKVSERLPEPEMRSEGLGESLKIEVSGIVCVNIALECIIWPT